MATAREIKRRIGSVRKLGQVTRALQAVAASNVRKAQAAALATRPYAHAAWEVIVTLGAATDTALHPLLTRRSPVNEILIVLFAGERGLCGAYNQNIVQAALRCAGDRLGVCGPSAHVHYIVVGRRGQDMLWRIGAKVSAAFPNLPAVPSLLDIAPIARAAIDEFLEGQADEVYLAYTNFITLMLQRPLVQRLLPLRPTELDTQAMMEYVGFLPPRVTQYLFEPDAATVLSALLPRFTELQVYQAALEAHASEYAARMVAMRNATDNAVALVEELTLDYNKARQQSITTELLDIAGGAEAQAAGQR